MRDTVMLLARQGTWTLSARVHFCCPISFPLTASIPQEAWVIQKFTLGLVGISLYNLYVATLALNSLIVDLSECESLIQRKHDVLARFIHVLKLLIELYNIPQTSLQIFADKEGQLISLNRGGCLAMNLRYFEAWRTS